MVDSYGERMAEFAMYDMNPFTNEFDLVISSTIDSRTDVILQYNESTRPIYWHKLKTGHFMDSPKCGFNNAKCPIQGSYQLY